MRKKVLYYSLQPNDTTAFWRTGGVLPYINSSEFELVDISLTINFNWSVLIGADILILQRPFTRDHANLIVLAKDMGIKVILDYDDLLTAVDLYNPTHQLYGSNQQSLFDCLNMADEIWVSTQAIKDGYKHLNTHIIPNSWNDYMFKVKDKKPFTGNKKVFWRGGSSHKADVMEVADKLVSFINENKDWTFLFQGDRFEYIEQRTGDNHHIVGGMSIIQYFKYLLVENPSIMIFPLCNTPFNKAKSNISFLEATYAGAAFFGNKNLPEFEYEDLIYDFDRLSDALGYYPGSLKLTNELSWEYITDNLLLSNINKKRTERIIANL